MDKSRCRFDNDGDKDVLTSCEDSDEMGALAWHENLGNDFPSPPTLVSDIIISANPKL